MLKVSAKFQVRNQFKEQRACSKFGTEFTLRRMTEILALSDPDQGNGTTPLHIKPKTFTPPK